MPEISLVFDVVLVRTLKEELDGSGLEKVQVVNLLDRLATRLRQINRLGLVYKEFSDGALDL